VSGALRLERAFALDTARHLSIGGRYPTALALPDRWRTWQPFAVRAGLKLIRHFRPRIIWSTYPVASAHAIGARLARLTGLPWVADMRDPMVEHDPYSGIDYPRDPRIRAARLEIEREVVRHAKRVVFCTAGSLRISADRYGPDAASRFSIIPNGYDEQVFADSEQDLAPRERERQGFTLIHSGTVYPGDDRGPGALFAALATLRDQGRLPANFRLSLRATGYDAEMRALVESAAVGNLVEIAPAVPYRQALGEMLQADGLLLLQGAASNPAIPAKLYEYLRARRPLLALVHPAGDSAALLRELNAAVIAPLDDARAIATALGNFLDRCAAGTAPVVSKAVADRFSRRTQTGELAALLNSILA